MQAQTQTIIHLPFNKYPLYDPSNRRGKKKKDKEESGNAGSILKKVAERQ
jgi:hypothetical protein